MKTIQIIKLVMTIKENFPSVTDERLAVMVDTASASGCTEFVIWSEVDEDIEIHSIASVNTRLGACSINACTINAAGTFYQSGFSKGVVYPARGKTEEVKVVSNLNDPIYVAL